MNILESVQQLRRKTDTGPEMDILISYCQAPQRNYYFNVELSSALDGGYLYRCTIQDRNFSVIADDSGETPAEAISKAIIKLES